MPELHTEILERIQNALSEANRVFARFTPGDIQAEYKAGRDPVTEADRELDSVLRKQLLRSGEGWLSEESADDLSRLRYEQVWIVDPLDGTREFVAGIPEFCTSIAFVVNGRPFAGGIYNPATNEVFLGSVSSGITHNGAPAHASRRKDLAGAVVLASRSETGRGEWDKFRQAPFLIQPTGSVAYKLAKVAAGLAGATFTLSPKHEWDVAAGVTLVKSAGGFARPLNAPDFRFNQKTAVLPGLLACGCELRDELEKFLEIAIPAGD
jgi:myo-inositol-1(or 4)-monophosphatase